MDFLKANYEWIFSGAGVVILAGLVTFFRKAIIKVLIMVSGKVTKQVKPKPAVRPKHHRRRRSLTPDEMEEQRRHTNILFIDDDTRFRVVSMLRKWGWVNTRLVKDIPAIDDEKIQSAHIVFEDIYGTLFCILSL